MRLLVRPHSAPHTTASSGVHLTLPGWSGTECSQRCPYQPGWGAQQKSQRVSRRSGSAQQLV